MNSTTLLPRKTWNERRGQIFADHQRGWNKRQPGKRGSGSRSFPSNNIVPLNHRGDAHPRTAVFHSTLYSHNFAQGSDTHFLPIHYLPAKPHPSLHFTPAFHH